MIAVRTSFSLQIEASQIFGAGSCYLMVRGDLVIHTGNLSCQFGKTALQLKMSLPDSRPKYGVHLPARLGGSGGIPNLLPFTCWYCHNVIYLLRVRLLSLPSSFCLLLVIDTFLQFWASVVTALRTQMISGLSGLLCRWLVCGVQGLSAILLAKLLHLFTQLNSEFLC